MQKQQLHHAIRRGAMGTLASQAQHYWLVWWAVRFWVILAHSCHQIFYWLPFILFCKAL